MELSVDVQLPRVERLGMVVRKGRHGGSRVDHGVELAEELLPPLLQLQARRVGRQPFTMDHAPAARTLGLQAAVVGRECRGNSLRLCESGRCAGAGFALRSTASCRAARIRRDRAATGLHARPARQICRAGRPAARCAERTASPVGISGCVSITSTRKSLSCVMPRGRQRQAIADAVARLVGSGDHVEREREVGGAARHRPDDRQIAPAGDRAGAGGRLWPRSGTRPRLGLWANTPQKCAGTRSEPPMSEPSSSAHEARGQRRGRAARRTAGRAAEVPGIVGACRRSSL